MKKATARWLFPYMYRKTKQNYAILFSLRCMMQAKVRTPEATKSKTAIKILPTSAALLM